MKLGCKDRKPQSRRGYAPSERNNVGRHDDDSDDHECKEDKHDAESAPDMRDLLKQRRLNGFFLRRGPLHVVFKEMGEQGEGDVPTQTREELRSMNEI